MNEHYQYRQKLFWTLYPKSAALKSDNIGDLFLGPRGKEIKNYSFGEYQFILTVPTTSTPLDSWSVYSTEQWSVFVEGVFYEQPCSLSDAVLSEKFAQSVLENYLEKGAIGFRDLNGQFSGFIIDHVNQKIISFNDRFASRMIYAQKCANHWKDQNAGAINNEPQITIEMEIMPVAKDIIGEKNHCTK